MIHTLQFQAAAKDHLAPLNWLVRRMEKDWESDSEDAVELEKTGDNHSKPLVVCEKEGPLVKLKCEHGLTKDTQDIKLELG